ncbi:hypothetical protein, partial [Streptomyces sp. NPDC002671]
PQPNRLRTQPPRQLRPGAGRLEDLHTTRGLTLRRSWLGEPPAGAFPGCRGGLLGEGEAEFGASFLLLPGQLDPVAVLPLNPRTQIIAVVNHAGGDVGALAARFVGGELGEDAVVALPVQRPRAQELYLATTTELSRRFARIYTTLGTQDLLYRRFCLYRDRGFVESQVI